ncbi:MAG: rRNA maturation RNase YbeY [Gammaproteobacteria bacterium]
MNADKAPVELVFQIAVDTAEYLPAERKFSQWVDRALTMSDRDIPAGACVTIRIVGAEESAELNQRYRGQAKPTNVLAFPAGQPVIDMPEGEEAELGDLVVCLEVASREATEQQKKLGAHLAHLAVHGTLHLIGYDHQDDVQAEEMESLEKQVLANLGFDDPYQTVAE